MNFEYFLPDSVISQVGEVLRRGSKKEGRGDLTYNKPKIYYLYKAIKHLIRWFFCRWDKDSDRNHLAHTIVRLYQLLAKDMDDWGRKAR